MESPRRAQLRHLVTEAQAHVQSLDRYFPHASSPTEKADIELVMNYYRAVWCNAENVLELHDLLNGGIAAKKAACAHPERHVSKAPPPISPVWDRRPPVKAPSYEEKLYWKKAQLQNELRQAEARKSELETAIARWRTEELPDWEEITRIPKSRLAAGKFARQFLSAQSGPAVPSWQDPTPVGRGTGSAASASNKPDKPNTRGHVRNVAAMLRDPDRFPVMTVDEAAEALGLTRPTIYRMLEDGRLKRAGLGSEYGTRRAARATTKSVIAALQPET